jgi:tetratricopeptide (TPR) repeat protein
MATGKARGNRKPKNEDPVPFDRRLMDQQMAAIGRLLEEQGFESPEEANAFLREILSSGELPRVAPATPLDEAQEVIFQALETTGKRREKLARKALSISPDCADAYVLLAEAAKQPEEARRLYEQGVQAGERALGEEMFAQQEGHFWGILETRPYMRARLGLADTLWELGERQAAIEHLQAMLRLNPGDNQGVRYLLASWLLIVKDDAALDRLLAQYPDEWSAFWAYTKALHTFRRKGAKKQAAKALQQAVEVNPFVPAYLLGFMPLPKQLPPYYGMGTPEEAVIYLAEAGEAWMEIHGALEWLADFLLQPPAPSPGMRAPKSNPK